MSHCVDTSTSPILLYEAPPESNIVPRADAPGTGPTGGPPVADFFLQDRRSGIPPSNHAFYQIRGEKLAVTPNLVLYRQFTNPDGSFCSACNSYLNASRAQQLLNQLEMALPQMRDIYGVSNRPDVQANGGRIVILAADIRDDYDSLGNRAYIAGFFAPRDLYADKYTSALFYHQELLQKTPAEIIVQRRGRSNENNLLYVDLNPLLSGAAFSGSSDSEKKAKAIEAALETLLHEMSHLFTFNYRVRIRNFPLHDTWITEGIAELAPVITLGRQHARLTRLQEFSSPIIQAYLGLSPALTAWGVSEESFVASSTGGTIATLASYIQSYLFFSYLQHRTAPLGKTKALLVELISNPEPGVQGVKMAIEKTLGVSYEGIYTDWVVATVLSARGRQLQQYFKTSPDRKDSNTYISIQSNPSLLAHLRQRFSYQAAGILAYGEAGLAFRKNSIPLSFAENICLNPSSFFVTVYTPNNTSDMTDVNQVNPVLAQNVDVNLPNAIKADPTLKIFILRDTIGNNARLLEYDNSTNNRAIYFNLTANSVDLYFIVINPTSQGSCTNISSIPSNPKNVAAWLGNGTNGFKKTRGADFGYAPRFFARPGGMSVISDPGPDNNYHTLEDNTHFLFVTDYLQNTVSRWNFRNGNWQGRLGRRQFDPQPPAPEPDQCSNPLDDGLDYFADKNHQAGSPEKCKSQFFGPRDVLAVPVRPGNPYYPYYLLIADSNNHRIVRRTREGHHAGFLGHSAFPNRFTPLTEEWLTHVYNPLDPRQIDFPHDLEIPPINPENPTTIPQFVFLYIYDTGKGRILRRRLDLRSIAEGYDATTDGKYEGFIGQGEIQWNTTITSLSIPRQNLASHFFASSANGIGLEGAQLVVVSGVSVWSSEYIYATEDEGHRIKRIRLNNGDGSVDPNFAWLGSNPNQPGWQTSLPPLQPGYQKFMFRFPADVEVDDNFLYVADKGNHRLVRIDKNPSEAKHWGWLGQGLTTWEFYDYEESNFLDVNNCATNPAPLATDICFPIALAKYTLLINFTPLDSALYGQEVPFLLMSAVYHNRMTRWNLKCANSANELLFCRDY